MTVDQIISKLRKKDFDPIYFLAGEEAYHIDTDDGIPQTCHIKGSSKHEGL